MKKLGVLLLALLIIPSVFAATEAKLTIKTAPLDNLVIRIQNPISLEIVGSVYAKANMSGVAKTNFSTTFTKIALTVIVVEKGQIMSSREFKDLDTTKPILVYMDDKYIPNETANIATNLTVNVTNSTTNNTNGTLAVEAKKQSVTGNAITENLSSIPSYTYYIILGVLIVGIVGFFIMRNRSSVTSSFGGSYSPPTEPSPDKAAALAAAQDKIRQLESEVYELKNHEKIAEAEKRMEAAKEELERLKRGY